MVDIWFSADFHGSHFNILRFCSRPFASVEEMDEALIENHNKLVKPNDFYYNLGDFGRNINIARRLNGRKFLLQGNHDWKLTEKLAPYFIWIKDTFLLKTGTEQIWLAHYPHRAWPGAYRGSYHFFGHVHNRLPPYGRSCDVGVDAWDYKPVNLDTLIKKLKDAKLEKDNVEDM